MNVTCTIQTATSTINAPARLSGRWLLAARALWCVLAIYPMALFALGIAPAIALYRVPCGPSVCTPIDWRVLSLEQAQALAARGISPDLYAFYTIGLLTFQALVFAGCGWLIFCADRMSRSP